MQVETYIMGDKLTELSLKRADKLRLEREEQIARKQTGDAEKIYKEFGNLGHNSVVPTQ